HVATTTAHVLPAASDSRSPAGAVTQNRPRGNDALTTAGYRLASLAAKLSPTPVVSGTAFALSGPLALAMRSKRQMVERHLRRILPQASTLQIRQMTQAAFESYARYYLETFRLSQVSMRTILRRWRSTI
ncbi:MAG: hypothetical protein ACKOQZ_08550, partial [Actinomycetota bacterium]